MEDQDKQIPQPDDNTWLDELLGTSMENEPLGIDDAAMDSHDMGQISDRELDEILKDVAAQDWAIEDFEPKLAPPSDADFYADNGQTAAEPVEEAEAEPEDPDAPVRKVRPKGKKGYGFFGIPHLLSTGIWLALAVVVGISLGQLVWICAADVLAFGRPDQNITITITEQDTVDTVTDKLYEAGLIQYKTLFKLYAELANADEKISVGTFTLNTRYDYHALVSGLQATSTDRTTVEVVIPEGYTCAQIFALLEEKGVSTVEILENYAATSEFASYEFLEGVERGHKYCLEGYMYPNTYEFYENDTPQRIFHKFLSSFADNVDEELLAYLDILNEKQAANMRKHGYSQSYIDENKLTLHDVITMASIVEKESARSDESYEVASVFYNRLAHPDYPRLDSDATVHYAIGDFFGEIKDLSPYLSTDSPYNTRKNGGLPPGPISNPGLSSIMASLSPAETNYYYFYLDPSAGMHLFAETYEQHKDNIASIEGKQNG